MKERKIGGIIKKLIKPEFKVESDVPPPVPGVASWVGWPYPTMKVGDSFLLGDDVTTVTRCRASASYYTRIYKKDGVKFSIRKTPDGFRCWRTA